MTLHNPVEIYKDDKGFVKGVKLEKMELGEPDERGRRSPVPTGEMIDLVCDCVIMALGTSSNPLLVRSEPRFTDQCPRVSGRQRRTGNDHEERLRRRRCGQRRGDGHPGVRRGEESGRLDHQGADAEQSVIVKS